MIVSKPVLPEVIFGDETLKRMTPLFAEIVRHQREIEDYCSEPVVNMRAAQCGFDRRTFLAREAERRIAVLRSGDA